MEQTDNKNILVLKKGDEKELKSIVEEFGYNLLLYKQHLDENPEHTGMFLTSLGGPAIISDIIFSENFAEESEKGEINDVLYPGSGKFPSEQEVLPYICKTFNYVSNDFKTHEPVLNFFYSPNYVTSMLLGVAGLMKVLELKKEGVEIDYSSLDESDVYSFIDSPSHVLALLVNLTTYIAIGSEAIIEIMKEFDRETNCLTLAFENLKQGLKEDFGLFAPLASLCFSRERIGDRRFHKMFKFVINPLNEEYLNKIAIPLFFEFTERFKDGFESQEHEYAFNGFGTYLTLMDSLDSENIANKVYIFNLFFPIFITVLGVIQQDIEKENAYNLVDYTLHVREHLLPNIDKC